MLLDLTTGELQTIMDAMGAAENQIKATRREIMKQLQDLTSEKNDNNAADNEPEPEPEQ